MSGRTFKINNLNCFYLYNHSPLQLFIFYFVESHHSRTHVRYMCPCLRPHACVHVHFTGSIHSLAASCLPKSEPHCKIKIILEKKF